MPRIVEQLECSISGPADRSAAGAYECVTGSSPLAYYDFFAGLTITVLFLVYLFWIRKLHKESIEKEIKMDGFMKIIFFPPLLISVLVAFFVFIRQNL